MYLFWEGFFSLKSPCRLHVPELSILGNTRLTFLRMCSLLKQKKKPILILWKMYYTIYRPTVKISDQFKAILVTLIHFCSF